jgi:hypothetical protein
MAAFTGALVVFAISAAGCVVVADVLVASLAALAVVADIFMPSVAALVILASVFMVSAPAFVVFVPAFMLFVPVCLGSIVVVFMTVSFLCPFSIADGLIVLVLWVPLVPDSSRSAAVVQPLDGDELQVQVVDPAEPTVEVRLVRHPEEEDGVGPGA